MNKTDPMSQTDRHPAFDESANNLTDMLRGLVSRWETLDITVSPKGCGLQDHVQAWQAAHGAGTELPRAYERR